MQNIKKIQKLLKSIGYDVDFISFPTSNFKKAYMSDDHKWNINFNPNHIEINYYHNCRSKISIHFVIKNNNIVLKMEQYLKIKYEIILGNKFEESNTNMGEFTNDNFKNIMCLYNSYGRGAGIEKSLAHIYESVQPRFMSTKSVRRDVIEN